MQQQPSVMPVMSSFPPTNITTEQIQKYLDENKKLILAILDNQNLGKLAECAQYQAQLQKNLMYLAAIADAQPQMPAMPTQMAAAAAAASPHPAMQQGGYYMHPQGAGPGMGQNPQGGFSPKMQMQFGSPHQQLHQQQQQQQQQQQLHQQAMQGQLNMRSGGGPGNGMHPMHSEGGGPLGGGQNRQSGLETDAPGSSAGGDNSKGAEEGK